jgi:hypothetical protein
MRMFGPRLRGRLRVVDEEGIRRVAQLLADRNVIDAEIAGVMGRPMASGHLGEWIASQIFGIQLEPSAVAAGIDGRFRAGPLDGQTVNVKWYLKREGLLDLSDSSLLDYYLVLTGPGSSAISSKGWPGPRAGRVCSQVL